MTVDKNRITEVVKMKNEKVSLDYTSCGTFNFMPSRKTPKVAGKVIEAVIGMTVGGALASGALVAVLGKIGGAVDKKGGL